MAPRSSRQLAETFSVPIHHTDSSAHKGAFAYMKERFAAEMRKMDEEMSKFTMNLLEIYGQTTSVKTGKNKKSSGRDPPATNWDVITKSPLVEHEGNQKILKLQFDVSEYEPEEISVRILNNMLLISAVHQENSVTQSAYNEFNREFLLPIGTEPESVESYLSQDGVLTVRAPLTLEMPKPDSGSLVMSDDEA